MEMCCPQLYVWHVKSFRSTEPFSLFIFTAVMDPSKIIEYEGFTVPMSGDKIDVSCQIVLKWLQEIFSDIFVWTCVRLTFSFSIMCTKQLQFPKIQLLFLLNEQRRSWKQKQRNFVIYRVMPRLLKSVCVEELLHLKAKTKWWWITLGQECVHWFVEKLLKLKKWMNNDHWLNFVAMTDLLTCD